MKTVQAWLVGKKTYLLSAGLLLALVILVALGKLTPVTAGALIMAAAFGFPATIKAAMSRHHNEEIELLEEIAVTGAAALAHNMPAAEKAGMIAARSGITLVDEIQKEPTS